MTLLEQTLTEVRRRSGLVFSDVRLHAAAELVQHWLREHDITSTDQLQPGPMLDELIERIVIHESYFDRDIDQLNLIDELVLAPRNAADQLAVWSAGCAGGEEAYTLAFMLESRGMLARASLVATDISHAALVRARTGRYRQRAVRTGERTRAMRYLSRVGAELQVPDAIRRRVEFRVLNLLEDAYPAHCDLILCRNVLIYLSPEAIAQIAPRLEAALAPDGFLFVAPSDPRLDPCSGLEATVTDRGIYYRRPQPKRAAPSQIGAPVARARPHVQPPPPPRVPARAEPVSISRLADRGEYGAARSALAESLRSAPLDPELHFLSAVLTVEDDLGAALTALERAMYLAPDMPASYLFAGRLYQLRGDTRLARRAYRTALSLLEQMPVDATIPWIDESAGVAMVATREAMDALR